MSPRTNTLGAAFWILGSLVFVIGMIVAQIGYGSSYSLTQNHISDLGALHCGLPSGPGAESGYLYAGAVCSPWHDVFNTSIIVDGILLVLGVFLVRTSLPKGKTGTIGLGLLVAAGIGSVGVGLFPEDANFLVHSLSAALVFLAGNLALIILTLSKFTGTKWIAFRLYSILSGSVGLTAFILFLSMVYGPIGVGGMEHLIVDPLILWLVVTGVRLACSDRGHSLLQASTTSVRITESIKGTRI